MKNPFRQDTAAALDRTRNKLADVESNIANLQASRAEKLAQTDDVAEIQVIEKRQTGARAEILGDPRRRIWEWEQHDESLEAFEKRVEAEAEALHQTSG